MRVALVCLRGAINMASWRGNADSIVASLQAQGHTVERIDHRDECLPIFYKPKQLFHQYVLRQSYSRHREPAMLRHYGRAIGRRIAALDVDVVLSLTAMPVPYLDVGVPVVIWNDAPFDALVDFYPGFSRLSRASRRDGYEMERAAHALASRAVYSSTWGARAAEAYGYGERLRVVPFGANVAARVDDDAILATAARRSTETVRLAWIGMEWARKGGDVALEVAKRLEAAGVSVRLSLAGVAPPRGMNVPSNVDVLGFVTGTEKEALLADANFLLLPSRADCSPIVFAEAAAFATPSLASRVGGIPAMVRDGTTGQTFDADDVAGYVSYLKCVSGNRAAYADLCRGALALYRAELNWQSATSSIARILQEAIDEAKRADRPFSRSGTR
ncbi:MAG: glycosyltransferase family 4 protein [Vulcanimicrobiaceae bacterium]